MLLFGIGGTGSVSAMTFKAFSSTSKTIKVSATATKNKMKIDIAMKKRRQTAQKQKSIPSYFQYLSDGSLKTKKELASTQQPLILYTHDSSKPQAGESGTITPVRITKDQFLADAPHGPMYGMVNWLCSAAADYLSYTPDAAAEQKFGVYSGDCTNSDAFITGNFVPQALGTFDSAVPLTFTLRNVDPEDQTIIQKLTTDPGECDIDYYKSFGQRDVYAAQYSCDDGYFKGDRDDIQFTVYVFPKNWPDSSNVEAVLKNQSSDEDKDGLIRRLELEIGTDPTVADTDKDGIKDGDEYLAYQTNPLLTDTDGDGVKDGVEVAQKTNPLGPGAATADQLDRWNRLKDITKPVISDIGVSFATDVGTPDALGTATVSWTTDLSADGIINWGVTSTYGSHQSDFFFAKSHAITFSVLPGTVYHYAIRGCSTGPNAKCTTSTDLTFTTPAAATVTQALSNVIVKVYGHYATVSWTAAIASDGIVNYGLTTDYGTHVSDYVFTTSHTIMITLPTSGVTYHYAIRACTTDALCTPTQDATFVAP